MEQRLQELLAYLHGLTEVQRSGVSVFSEINDAMVAIQDELGIEQKTSKPALNVPIGLKYARRVVQHHPLIEVEVEPMVAGTSYSVREILNELSRGKTVHQLSGEYNLVINQISAAVIYAAWMLSDKELCR